MESLEEMAILAHMDLRDCRDHGYTTTHTNQPL